MSARSCVYDHQLLAATLRIRSEHVRLLAAFFDEHVRENGVVLGEPRQTVAAIRDFLHAQKMQYRKPLEGSILGQRGCFSFSVRSGILAGLRGIKNGLAHSTGFRYVHVMLVDEHGVPFDSRELTRGGVVPMSLRDVQFYERYILKGLTLYNAAQRRYKLRWS